MMKEVVLRDWVKLTAEVRNELKGYIIHHVVQRQDAMPPYLRRQLLQVMVHSLASRLARGAPPSGQHCGTEVKTRRPQIWCGFL